MIPRGRRSAESFCKPLFRAALFGDDDDEYETLRLRLVIYTKSFIGVAEGTIRSKDTYALQQWLMLINNTY